MVIMVGGRPCKHLWTPCGECHNAVLSEKEGGGAIEMQGLWAMAFGGGAVVGAKGLMRM